MFNFKNDIMNILEIFRLRKFGFKTPYDKNALKNILYTYAGEKFIVNNRSLVLTMRRSDKFKVTVFSDRLANKILFFVYSPFVFGKIYNNGNKSTIKAILFPSLLMILFSSFILFWICMSLMFLPLLDVYVTFILKDDTIFPVTVGFIFVSFFLFKLLSAMGANYTGEKHALTECLKQIVEKATDRGNQ